MYPNIIIHVFIIKECSINFFFFFFFREENRVKLTACFACTVQLYHLAFERKPEGAFLKATIVSSNFTAAISYVMQM